MSKEDQKKRNQFREEDSLKAFWATQPPHGCQPKPTGKPPTITDTTRNSKTSRQMKTRRHRQWWLQESTVVPREDRHHRSPSPLPPLAVEENPSHPLHQTQTRQRIYSDGPTDTIQKKNLSYGRPGDWLRRYKSRQKPVGASERQEETQGVLREKRT